MTPARQIVAALGSEEGISLAGCAVRPGHAAGWLSDSEARLLSPRATPRRWAEFAAGRRAARAAVGRLVPGAQVEIVREEGAGAGRPLVILDGRPAHVEVSISHTDGLAVAAAALGRRLGLDAVSIEVRGPTFRAEAFTAGEWACWRRAFAPLADAWDEALIESIAFAAKEAALKWLGCGLRAPLLGLSVTPLGRPATAPDAEPLVVAVRRCGAGVVLRGRIFRVHRQVAVLLGDRFGDRGTPPHRPEARR